nr:Chain O, Dynein light chain 2A [Tetrahymena thermophila]7K5B_O Chain O, Dynein light chain 2A [Tetrahymena thermophila]
RKREASLITLNYIKNRFYPSKIQKIIKELFEDRLKGVEYDPNNANQLSERLVLELREKIKRGKVPRYKIGVQVVFGEIKGQGLRIASKCLWDVQNDNYASYTYTSEKVYCTGIVFGCYFE